MARGLNLEILGTTTRGGRRWWAAYSERRLVEFTHLDDTPANALGRILAKACPTDGEEVRVDVTNIDQYHSIRGAGDNGPQS